MITKQNKNQSLKQRTGKLIEQYVCDKYSLLPNKRQQTKGHFDAYNKQHIYEIKAVKTTFKDTNPRITLINDNHKKLQSSECGKYLIINYNLIDKDKNLQLIQDINIRHEINIYAETMSEIISNNGIPYERKYKNGIRHHIRIKLNDILKVGHEK